MDKWTTYTVVKGVNGGTYRSGKKICYGFVCLLYPMVSRSKSSVIHCFIQVKRIVVV